MTVARLAARLSVAELASSFAWSRRRIKCGLLAVFLAAVCSGVSLGWVTSRSIRSVPDPELAGMLVRTASAGALLSACLAIVIVSSTAPASPTLGHLLAVLPVRSAARRLGIALPVRLCALVLALPLTAPSLFVVWKVLPTKGAVTGSLLIVSGALLLQSLIAAVMWLTKAGAMALRIRNPVIGSTLSAAAGLAVALTVFGTTVLQPTQRTSLDGINYPSIVATISSSGLNGPIIIALGLWWLLAAGLVWLSVVNHPSEASSALFPVGRGLPVPARPHLGAAVVSMLVLLRSPQAILACIGAVGVVIACGVTPTTVAPAELLGLLATSAPGALFALIMFGPGRTVAWSWTGSMLSARRTWWVGPMIAAYLVFAVVIAALLVTTAAIANVLAITDVPSMAARSALVFACALLAGALVPWTESQPVSGTVSMILLIVLYFGASIVADGLADGDAIRLAMVAVSAFVIGLLGWMRAYRMNYS